MMNQTEKMAAGQGDPEKYVFPFTSDSAWLRALKLTTRLAFFIAGFGLSCWAPLVPFAQERMQAEPAMLGIVLLCLGFGAVVGMPVAGGLSAKIGCKPVIIAGALGLAMTLPLLAILSSPVALGVTLFIFGASLGATDVAANVHGTHVQSRAGIPLMSGFHGFYSLGGLAGASVTTAIIASGWFIWGAASIASLAIILCLIKARAGFVHTREDNEHPFFVLPKGKVVVIGVLAMVLFLAEGAMLDWGALLLIQVKNISASTSGAGYVIFAVAMALSRFVGDRIVAGVGEKVMLIAGVTVTGCSLFLIAWLTPLFAVFAAIALAGFAAGNVVPVLFTLAGKQKSMPATLAISAASILGYLGVLMGPAFVGFVAHFTGLKVAFFCLGGLVVASSMLIRLIKCENVAEEETASTGRS